MSQVYHLEQLSGRYTCGPEASGEAGADTPAGDGQDEGGDGEGSEPPRRSRLAWATTRSTTFGFAATERWGGPPGTDPLDRQAPRRSDLCRTASQPRKKSPGFPTGSPDIARRPARRFGLTARIWRKENAHWSGYNQVPPSFGLRKRISKDPIQGTTAVRSSVGCHLRNRRNPAPRRTQVQNPNATLRRGTSSGWSSGSPSLLPE